MAVTVENPARVDMVACEGCRKQIPVAEAVVTEATDYFAYFCSPQCLEQWKHRGDQRPATQQSTRD